MLDYGAGMKGDFLSERVRVSADKAALIFNGEMMTYGELDNAVSNLAARLRNEGVREGTHLGVLLNNRVEYVFLIHAVARLGAVLVPVNTRLTKNELLFQVKNADCEFILCDMETENTVKAASEFRVILNIEKISRAPASQDVEPSEFNLNAVQAIIHTSGTTGQPKGVVLTWANHFWSATASAFRLGTKDDDRWLLCMPLYHVGGMAIVLRCCLYGTAVVFHERFDLDAVAQSLKVDKVTLISVVPTMLSRLAEAHLDSLKSEQLRTILVGGAALDADQAARFCSLGLPVATTYGLSEASSQAATATVEEVFLKPGSVGKPLMFSEIRICDAENHLCAVDEIGEIQVSGPGVMREYYNNSGATAKTLVDGWLRTGDLGRVDADGDLWVINRRTDLIVSGGENIYPAEVERVLNSHPAVKEAVVVGVADLEWGQRPVAGVVLNGEPIDEEALKMFGRGQLAGYKIPKNIFILEDFPRTSSGKVKRDAVRAFFQSQLGTELSARNNHDITK